MSPSLKKSKCCGKERASKNEPYCLNCGKPFIPVSPKKKERKPELDLDTLLVAYKIGAITLNEIKRFITYKLPPNTKE